MKIKSSFFLLLPLLLLLCFCGCEVLQKESETTSQVCDAIEDTLSCYLPSSLAQVVRKYVSFYLFQLFLYHIHTSSAFITYINNLMMHSMHDLENTKTKIKAKARQDSIFASAFDLATPLTTSLESGPCIFQELRSSCHILSDVSVHEVRTSPSSHAWSHCHHCVMDTHTLQLNIYHNGTSFSSSTASNTTTIDLSWSVWGEFFFTRMNDQFKAHLQTVPPHSLGMLLKPSEILYIKRPVFIIPMITLHPGKHICPVFSLHIHESIHFSRIISYLLFFDCFHIS